MGTVVEMSPILALKSEMLKHDQSNRWMLALEIAVVVLFIIDVVMLFSGPKK